MEITDACENLAILEQFSISSKIVTIYTLFALGPSIIYICKQKLFRQGVNRLWNRTAQNQLLFFSQRHDFFPFCRQDHRILHSTSLLSGQRTQEFEFWWQ